MTIRELRRRLDRIKSRILPEDWFAALAEMNATIVGPGEPDPPGLAEFVASGGDVLRPDEPIPNQPIL